MEQAAGATGEKRRNFVSDVLKLVGGASLANVVGILVAPALSRLYAPEAFGTAAVFVSLVQIVAVIACLRYEFAIMLPQQDEEAANVLALSLGMVLVTTTIGALLLYLLRQEVLAWLKAPGLGNYLWLAPLTLLAIGAFQALSYWNSRTKHYGWLSIARVLSSVTTSATQLGMGLARPTNAGGLIGGSVIGSALITLLLGAQIWQDDGRLFRKHVRLTKIWNQLVNYRKFPLIDSWGGFLNNLAWQLPALLLSSFFSQTIVGYYALTNRLIQFPMALVGSAMGQVFFQRSSEARSDAAKLAGIVAGVFQRLVALGLLPALLATLAGRELFIVAFGENWAEAGVYLQMLGLWMFFWFISSPLSTLFTVLERQELALVVHTAILATRITAFVAGGILGNIYLALGLFGGAGVLVYGGLTIWIMVLSGVPLCRILHILIRYGLYAVPPTLILLILKLWLQAPAPLIVAWIALALTAYYIWILLKDRSLLKATF